MRPLGGGREWDVFDPMQVSIVEQRMATYRRQADEARLADGLAAGSHRSIRTLVGSVLTGIGGRISGTLEEPTLRRV